MSANVSDVVLRKPRTWYSLYFSHIFLKITTSSSDAILNTFISVVLLNLKRDILTSCVSL